MWRKRPPLPFTMKEKGQERRESTGCCFRGDRCTHFWGYDEARARVPFHEPGICPLASFAPTPHPQTWPWTPTPPFMFPVSIQTTQTRFQKLLKNIPSTPEHPQAPMSPPQATEGSPGSSGGVPSLPPASRRIPKRELSDPRGRVSVRGCIRAGSQGHLNPSYSGGNECVSFLPLTPPTPNALGLQPEPLFLFLTRHTLFQNNPRPQAGRS